MTAPPEILAICTANICRSPMAEALLARCLDERGVDAHVQSAGRMRGGKSMTAEGLEVMRRRGLDLSDHRSQRLTSRMVNESDLVIGMSREHVVYALGLAHDALPRAFTLKELVRRGRELGPCGPDEPLGEWLGRLHASRRPDDLLGSSSDDDIPDPIGQSLSRYEEIAEEIEDYSERLVALAWGTVRHST